MSSSRNACGFPYNEEEYFSAQPTHKKDVLDPKTSKFGKLEVCSKALHPEFTNPLIDVAEMSIEKGYEPMNWLKPGHEVSLSSLLAAAQRHLNMVKMGIDKNDFELKIDGTPCRTVLHAAQC